MSPDRIGRETQREADSLEMCAARVPGSLIFSPNGHPARQCPSRRRPALLRKALLPSPWENQQNAGGRRVLGPTDVGRDGRQRAFDVLLSPFSQLPLSVLPEQRRGFLPISRRKSTTRLRHNQKNPLKKEIDRFGSPGDRPRGLRERFGGWIVAVPGNGLTPFESALPSKYTRLPGAVLDGRRAPAPLTLAYVPVSTSYS
jgi:hypothetical protein